ncbi:hypothetical protein CAPTEDRAFT_158253 [Capitella teleta]|uniref:Cold shock domain-containing protein E1 n=1 Tax=Capitella teleta TaxID=283909 RepID=R7UUB0_CAPTE|nr:hypothetical protein CAPTEDRAFT_158253 [Capitella teleta]|eukprot:ELU07507.1 hypothetical protein CAPTEDRAFT_158253 [Capitella teleta]
MASPQWKNYQPPAQQSTDLAFNLTSPPKMANLLSNGPNSPLASGDKSNITQHMMVPALRESGIVEKLLHTYGFIQCCEREARLFFHFSEFNGKAEAMNIGDPVEFQMSHDRRTGKPVAVSVQKMETGASFEMCSEGRVTGTVCIEAKSPKSKGGPLTQLNGLEGTGRVSYEQSGEHFFLPYAIEDKEEGHSLSPGDEVTFLIATDKRNGSVRARNIRLSKRTAPERSQGVVCSLKDNYGFIERSDVVKEIFFHYSELKPPSTQLRLGDDVEFDVQTRNNKEVATNIEKLINGTVIFEDVAVERRRGKIQKILKGPNGRRLSDPMAGRIVYETVKGPIEIPFGDKDQEGDYTLMPGDLVEFNIATDRRDKLQRATCIDLVVDSFKVNIEQREKGIVATLKDGFGFIQCADREGRMFFHYSENMDTKGEPPMNQEVEFTVIPDPTNPSRMIAVRLRYLPRGTITFDSILTEKHMGTVEKEAAIKSSAKNKDPDPGIIMYDVNGTKQTIPFGSKAVQAHHPKVGDKVEFQICESRKNNTKTAANVVVKLMRRNSSHSQSFSSDKSFGFIATLKDNFGFIEMADHEKEVFFHFSAFNGDSNDLDLGDEVEFILSRKTAKVSAENIRKIPKGSVAPEELLPGFLDGKVLRCMRILNPGQDDYPGIVQVGTDDDDLKPDTYPYGITSLADKRDFLQKGDIVKFQLCVVKGTGKKRATNIAAKRKYTRSRVDSVKGQFGFLNFEAEENKKLFFHMTEVHDGAEIAPGDEVEFVVVQNQRNQKYSAVSLRKISATQRPERLISRLKSVGDESGPRVQVIRPPLGPDGTKGFSRPRALWNGVSEP